MDASSTRPLRPSVDRIGDAQTASRGPRSGAHGAGCPNRQAHAPGRGAQKNLASTLSRGERPARLETGPSALPLPMQPARLSLHRSRRYYRPVGPDPVAGALTHRLDDIYTDRPCSGSRRMPVPLQKEGHAGHRPRLPRDRRERGIFGLAPGPRTRTPHPRPPRYPSGLTGGTPADPHHVWGIALTSIRLLRGGLDLVAIIEGSSRYGVAGELSESWALPCRPGSPPSPPKLRC